jgi:hypothetical protein
MTNNNGMIGLGTPPYKRHYSAYKCGTALTEWLTLVVLAITMCGVLWYACIASSQNQHLADSVDQQVMINRPVIIANGLGILKTNSNGIPTKVRIATVNFGESTASVVTAIGHIFAVNNGETAPFDPECKEGGPWPIDTKLTALVPFEQPQSLSFSLSGPPSNKKGQSTPPNITIVAPQPIGAAGWDWSEATGQDFNDVGGKTVFVVGCVFYEGLDKTSYFSDVCVSWDGTPNFPTCADRGRNYIH